MSRHELTISPDYVPDWTIVEAFRELFQNGLDQDTQENPFKFEWNHKMATFTSTNAFLDRTSILFGGGTKADDEEKIGAFGEGYKLALLVLTRLGYHVKIYNRKRSETWVPKIIKSRRYYSDLLVIDINYEPYAGLEKDLVIEIRGITDEDVKAIEASNLFFHAPNRIKTDIGDVLLDDEYKGKIYVSGLFICKVNGLDKGYDFKPGTLSLDRDRNMASTFDVCWATSRLWDKASIVPQTLKMMHAGAQDTIYVHSIGYNQEIRNTVYEDFKLKNPNGYPVSDQIELELIQEKFADATPIVVDKQVRDIILAHKDFVEPELRLKQTPYDILTELFNAGLYSNALSDQYLMQLVLEKSKEWK